MNFIERETGSKKFWNKYIRFQDQTHLKLSLVRLIRHFGSIVQITKRSVRTGHYLSERKGFEKKKIPLYEQFSSETLKTYTGLYLESNKKTHRNIFTPILPQRQKNSILQ